jgi:hypothetical protein
MRPNRFLGIVAMVGLPLWLLALGLSPSAGQDPGVRPAVVWEYKTFFGHRRQDDDRALNQFGQEGWELVVIGEDPRELVRYVFKRPKRK